MIQVNRIYLIFNRLVTKKFLVDTSEKKYKSLALLLPSVGKLHIFVINDIREVTNYV